MYCSLAVLVFSLVTRWYLEMFQAFLTIIAKKSIPYAFGRTLWIRNVWVCRVPFSWMKFTTISEQKQRILCKCLTDWNVEFICHWLQQENDRACSWDGFFWDFSQLQLSALWLANFICSDHLARRSCTAQFFWNSSRNGGAPAKKLHKPLHRANSCQIVELFV